jgi:predicted  nucleic acid-binding Zn-ribbon protein
MVLSSDAVAAATKPPGASSSESTELEELRAKLTAARRLDAQLQRKMQVLSGGPDGAANMAAGDERTTFGVLKPDTSLIDTSDDLAAMRAELARLDAANDALVVRVVTATALMQNSAPMSTANDANNNNNNSDSDSSSDSAESSESESLDAAQRVEQEKRIASVTVLEPDAGDMSLDDSDDDDSEPFRPQTPPPLNSKNNNNNVVDAAAIAAGARPLNALPDNDEYIVLPGAVQRAAATATTGNNNNNNNNNNNAALAPSSSYGQLPPGTQSMLLLLLCNSCG